MLPLAWLVLLLALPPLLLLLSQRLGPPQPPHVTYRPGMLKHLLRLDLLSVLELAVRERPVVRLGAWPLCMVVVSQADNLRQVLAGEYDWAPALWPPSTRVMLDLDSITHVTGDTHRWMRRVFLQAFSSARLRELVPALVGLAQAYCDRWADADGPVDVSLEVKAYTFEVIGRLANGMALSPPELQHCAQLFQEWQEALFVVPLDLPGTAFRRGVRAKAALMAYFEPHLRAMWRSHHGCEPPLQRSSCSAHEAGDAADGAPAGPQAAGGGPAGAAWPPGSASSTSVIYGMLRSGFSWAQLCGNAFQMFFAGHDTSSATLTVLLWYLGQSPSALAALAAEQARLQEQHGPEISWEVLEGMDYARACIKEALRLKPVVGAVFRAAARDFQVGGHTLRRGTMLMAFLRGTITGDARWAAGCSSSGGAGQQQEGSGLLDPLAFNPDRWLVPGADRAGDWVPFGLGPRMCPGYPLAYLEMKALLAAVVARRCTWRLHQPGAVQWRQFPMPRPTGGVWATFERLAAAQ